jgi:hypothetical protein
MFDMLGDSAAIEAAPIRLPDLEEVKGRDKLLWEKELLGVYAMAHPMQMLGVDLRNMVTCSCSELDGRFDGKNVMMAGMVTSVRTLTTKKGDIMAFVNLEDPSGQCELTIFPRTYADFRDKLVPDTVIVVKGKAQEREGRTSVLVDSIQNYVDVPKTLGEETPRYQTPLLDVGPTINGLAPDDGAEEYDGYSGQGVDATLGVENDAAEDIVPVPQDADVPLPEMPDWLRSEQEMTEMEPVYAAAPRPVGIAAQNGTTKHTPATNGHAKRVAQDAATVLPKTKPEAEQTVKPSEEAEMPIQDTPPPAMQHADDEDPVADEQQDTPDDPADEPPMPAETHAKRSTD